MRRRSGADGSRRGSSDTTRSGCRVLLQDREYRTEDPLHLANDFLHYDQQISARHIRRQNMMSRILQLVCVVLISGASSVRGAERNGFTFAVDSGYLVYGGFRYFSTTTNDIADQRTLLKLRGSSSCWCSRARAMTIAAWVRQALVAVRRHEPPRDVGRKLNDVTSPVP